MKLNDLSIRKKQLIGFAAILIMAIAVHSYSISRMGVIKEEIDEVSNNWLPRAIVIGELNNNTAILRITQLEHAYTFDKEGMQDLQNEMIALIDEINENIDDYDKLKSESEEQNLYSQTEERLYNTFLEKWEVYQDLSFEILRLSIENEKQKAIGILNTDAQKVAEDGGAALEQLVKLNQMDAFNAAKRAEKTFRSTKGITGIIMIATIVLSIFIAGGLVKMIIEPIRQLQNAAGYVAKGDYNIYFDIDSKDELGKLSESFIQMANSLKEAQNQLVQSEKMASLGQLTAGIAHEINNPINFVMSNVSPLKRDLEDILAILKKYESVIEEKNLKGELTDVDKLKKELDYEFLLDEIRSLLNGIEEGGKRTAEIVKGLRNFSRLDEDDMKLGNLNQGIESTLLMLRNELKNRIDIEKDFGEIPEILCYPGKMNQVFMNILSNASQAIQDKGIIKIKTEHKNGNVVISIKDNGKGMTQAVKNKIFEPFYTTKDVGKGTGLGLSISFGIIKDHEGTINVKSEIDKGTEFIITIPVKQ